MVRYLSARVAVLSALVLCAGASARPVFDIVKVADTQTPIPGGTGSFLGFSFPAAPGTAAAFVGNGSGGQRGVYLSDLGSVTRLADLSSAVPGGAAGAAFTQFQVVGGGASEGVLFRAESTGGTIGLYRAGVGPTSLVIDTAGPFPGAALTDFVWADYTNETTAISAVGASGYGAILRHSGGAVTIADINTPVPGGTGNFQSFGRVATDGASVAFVGAGAAGQQGVYSDSGGLHAVANTTTPIPGGTGTFTSFGDGVRLDQDSVLFIGDGAGGQRGIYLAAPGGAITTVIDSNAQFPGGANFVDFASPDLKEGGIVFWGEDAAGLEGVFVTETVGAFPVLLEGEILDGRVVQSIELAVSADAFDRFYVPMSITFTNGTSGVFVAKVPSPGAGALLLGGLGLVAVRRRRRLRA